MICNTEDDDWKEMVGRNEDTESLFDVKVDDVKTFLHNIRVSLGKIRHFQLMLGADYSSVCIPHPPACTQVCCAGHKPSEGQHG